MTLTDKLYKVLTPEQRAAATVSAIASGDRSEMQRLFDTAPRKNHFGPDYQFTAGVRAIERLTLMAALEIQHQIVRWTHGLALAEHGLRLGDLDGAEAERGEVTRARRAIAAIWHAYIATCEHAGVDALDAMRAFGAFESSVAAEHLGDVEPDPALLTSMRTHMTALIECAW